MPDDRPIGVFDSGIGGLTVLEEIHRLMPDEDLVYLGDTARVPYGSKSRDTVVRYTKNNLGFLQGQGVKMVVVACNTASAYALPGLSEIGGLPVIGVIEAGVEAAAKHSGARVGVIGTEATIKSGAYQKLLGELRPGASVQAKACPIFVPLVEEGWTQGHIAKSVVEEYLAEWRGQVDCLVLGCTHYPLLKGVISQALGQEVRMIDSAQETVRKVKQTLESRDMSHGPRTGKPRIRFFVTDSPQRSMEVARRMLGYIDIEDAVFVDIV